MNTEQLRYILYARKSEESEDRQVASVESQTDELTALAKKLDIHIVATLSEKRSAKEPGRLVFNQMIQYINDGKADAILCWKLNRLARNPVDGGTIQWLLQKSVIKHIRTFSGNHYPADNMIYISVELGMANQFILDLSVDTKRGQRAKIKEGWLPHKPPLGYYNKLNPKPDRPSTIDKDPAIYPFMKKLWLTLLQKRCSLEKIYEIGESMGITTCRGTISRANFYRLFRNPFYYGYFYWKGELYPGKHPRMITKEQFDQAQDIINGRSHPRSKAHEFAFTGLIRCGKCGSAITAESKTKIQKNGNVHSYTYYRCAKSLNRKCSQKTLKLEELEKQILSILAKINIPPSFHEWAIKQLANDHEDEKIIQDEIFQAQEKRLSSVNKNLNTLLDIRINGELSEEEYLAKKKQLLADKHKLEELLKDTNRRVETWLDQAETIFNLAETAKKRFEEGTLEDKRDILSSLGSNLSLLDGTLSLSMNNKLALILQVAPAVQELHNSLEPTQVLDSKGGYDVLYAQNKKWGLKQDTRRSTQPHTVQLVIAFYRRRKARLEVSLDLSFPPERRPAPPVNVIQQALQVRAYMTANPQETCLSAAKPLKIHRKRIAKLLRIIDALPPDFIEKNKECTDRKALHQMSVNRLVRLTNQTSPISNELPLLPALRK